MTGRWMTPAIVSVDFGDAGCIIWDVIIPEGSSAKVSIPAGSLVN